jgi:hypothetical protein
MPFDAAELEIYFYISMVQCLLPNVGLTCFILTNFVTPVTLGGLVVSMLSTGPTGHSVAGSNPTEGTSFGGEVKPSVPCCRFTACKRTLQSMSEMLYWPNFLCSVSHL